MAHFLEKQGTVSTPYVLIDEAKNYMKLEGRSFHENVVEFFEEVDGWLTEYLQSDFAEFTFDCEMNYFNSSTSKLLLNMIVKMDRAAEGGKKVTVNWITSKENDIVIECGEDFAEEAENLTFNLKVID